MLAIRSSLQCPTGEACRTNHANGHDARASGPAIVADGHASRPGTAVVTAAPAADRCETDARGLSPDLVLACHLAGLIATAALTLMLLGVFVSGMPTLRWPT